MAKEKHSVRVTEDFQVRTPLGDLVVAGRVIDPAREHVSTYQNGTLIQFSTKKDALAFVKHHTPKVTYIGKV